ncbi:MAG: YggT family protein [Pseudomonadota bacterium]
MLIQLFIFLLDAACGFLTLALLSRFILQRVKAPFRNPLGQFVIAMTDWIVRPVRRVIPGLFGWDVASLLLAWLLQALLSGLTLGLSGTLTAAPQGYLFHGVSLAPTFIVVLLAVLATIKIACYLLLGAVLVSAIFSWVNPHAPMADVFNAISRPLLRPFRRWIPDIGGVDLSPLAFILLLQMGMMVLERLRWVVLAG